MKLLVTGGAGFIGSNFTHHWVKKFPQDKIVVLDKLTYAGDTDNLEEILAKIHFIKGDVCDKKLVEKLAGNSDTSVHFAAESHNTRAEKNPEIFYQTNVEGTRAVLEAAKKMRVKKIIHLSTDEVYGSIEKGFFKEEDADNCLPSLTADYPKSKALADKLAREFAQKGLPIIVVRPTNNFGPRQHPEKALPRYITNIFLGQKMPIWGEGLQVRDWLYVKDTCRALEILIKKGVPGEVYNIAANNQPEIKNREVAEILCQILKINPKEWIEFVPDPRPNHDFRYSILAEKIRALGWQPSLDIQKQFQQTVEWYRQNPTWWQKRKAEAEKLY
ncbi:dTDP-glucose 4,6-dehydratase [Candidatus Berkelbacteria bacterium]|nr:dTDP-glucose 4,6-dehydratase [Candidatus Berkelbacteria bacterium]